MILNYNDNHQKTVNLGLMPILSINVDFCFDLKTATAA